MRSIFFIFSFIICFKTIGQTENVLFIGNSFTYMNEMCKMYQNLANSKGKNVFADTLAVGGSTLKGHVERANTYNKIKARDWDYVFIQAMSKELFFDSLTIEEETVPYAKKLIESIKVNNPCAKIYFYMTWGYQNGISDSTYHVDYLEMSDKIAKGYLQLSQSTGSFPIAPVGMVWKEVRKAYPNLNLYESDLLHPNSIGSFVAATTFYSSIYNQSAHGGATPKLVDPIVADNISSIAWQYVQKNRSRYNLDTIQIKTNDEKPKVDFTMTTKWLCVTLNNQFVNATDVRWDFGDGKSSGKSNLKYYYAKPGKYVITLWVKYDCKWYSVKKSVTVQNK